MAERPSYGLGPRLDFQQLQFEAQHRWLRPAEICEILRNYRMFQITSEPHNRPPSGSLFLFDRKVLRYFRKDGHNWRKKKDGKTVKEAHEKLKVGSVDVLHCYYAHGEENENFQRRSYWMLEPDMMHIVFVHYLEVKGNKTNIGGNTDNDEVSSDSQKVASLSSGIIKNCSSVPSLSADSMSPTSSLTSLREDADSGEIHQGSSGLHALCESQHMGNGPPTDKIDVGSNGSFVMDPFSGDKGQSSISGTDYIPLVQGDKFRGSDATYVDGQKAHGTVSWGTVLEQCNRKLHTDPSLVSFPIPSSSMGNVLEQELNHFSNVLPIQSGLTEEASTSSSLQSNWQIPFEDNSGHLPTLSQSLSLEFGSDYITSLLGNETHIATSEISPHMLSFQGEPKDLHVQQTYSEQHADGSQHASQSISTNKVPGEESINYAFSAKRTLLDRDESLKKVDSFSRWITKALGEVDDLNMQSSAGISWSTYESGHVIDDASLSPSLSQDQLFSINDFSPKWTYAEAETEVLIVGVFLKHQPGVTTYNWSCMFGEVEVPAEVLANGILCCQAPPHKVGRVPFYVTCSNRLACSEVREFDFREGYSGNIDFADCYDNSSDEMLLHLRLEELLSLKPVCPSNQAFGSDIEKRDLVFKLIAQKEEEEYSSKEEPTVELDISSCKMKEHLLHRQVKEKLYSWLLHKVTESGKGANVLDKDGQGVLHLVAALGYDWAIKPILTAGVNINFRDVNGWTALHWAAYCGRERTVAVLVSLGADTGASTDPTPACPRGKTSADLASINGHKGMSGFLGESLLTSHLELLTMDDQYKVGRQEISGVKGVQTASERTATPVSYGDMPDALCLKDSLTAVRNATQAADRIYQVFRMRSFQRKQFDDQYEDDELGLSDQRALSLLASKASKSGQGDGLANAAAIQIQKKYRGWKKRKEFLIIRQRIVKIQAHVRGHQARKTYKFIWSVGILKVILRWRRKGSGLRTLRPDALNKAPNQQSDALKEDDYDYLKEGRKLSEEKFQKALSRVKSMVQYPEARAQYRRLLNDVEDFRQTKASNMDVINSEETADGVDLIDIDMLLDDDNFIPIAFDS